tara:strand:- start:50 stop:277 length:228 start_codon:yes stop_codon:yes gene_type:complete
MRPADATIIGFRIIIDSHGVLMTEQTELPDEHISKVFKEEGSQVLVRAAIRSFKEIAGDMHSQIETEIDAINKIL